MSMCLLIFSPEDSSPVPQILCCIWNTRQWTKLREPLILSVIYHYQILQNWHWTMLWKVNAESSMRYKTVSGCVLSHCVSNLYEFSPSKIIILCDYRKSNSKFVSMLPHFIALKYLKTTENMFLHTCTVPDLSN
jgi:hypothetical protein